MKLIHMLYTILKTSYAAYALTLILMISMLVSYVPRTLACEIPQGALQLVHVEKQQETYVVYWNIDQSAEINIAYMPMLGQSIDIVRCIPPGKWVKVAYGTTRNLTGNLVGAQVQAVYPDAESNAFFALAQTANLYWQPMQGDVVLPRNARVSQNVSITPKGVFSLADLFIFENGEYSYELSHNGKESLRAFFKGFQGKRVKIVVEGFDHRTENREELAQASGLRAHAVARWLIQEFNLPEHLIYSIGLGSLGASSISQRVDPKTGTPLQQGIIIHALPQ